MIAWLISVVLLVFSSACAGQQEGKRTSMDKEQFERTFASALQERGPAYFDARKTILESGSTVLPLLDARQTSQDWRVVLEARILAGWIRNRDLYQRCVDYSDGKLPGKPGITGRFRPTERVREIVALGPAVVPCLIEMALKLRPLEGDQQAAVFGALKEIGGREAVAPLISLLNDDSVEIRRAAAGAIGTLGDPAAVTPLLAVLRDRDQPAAVRASAAESLGALKASQASPALQEIVRAKELPLDLRKAAVRGLEGLQDSAATPALVEAASAESDTSFVMLVVEALGKIGNRSALPALLKFQQHADRFVREAAKESHAKAAAR